MHITTITQKGQVTIPAEIRKRLNLKAGDKVIFEKKGDGASLGRIPDFSSLRGILKSKKPYNKKAVREVIGKYLAQRYLKTLK